MVRDEVTIRNCTFAFKCQANWDLLKKTDEKKYPAWFPSPINNIVEKI